MDTPKELLFEISRLREEVSTIKEELKDMNKPKLNKQEDYLESINSKLGYICAFLIGLILAVIF